MSTATHDDSGQFNGAAVLNWREPVSPRRVLRATACSIGIHILGVALFLALPETEFRYINPLEVTVDVRKSIPLVLPRDLLVTQRDPNIEKKVREELDIRSALPAKPSPPRAFQPPAPAGPKPQEAPVPLPAAPEVDVQVQAAVNIPVPQGGPTAPPPVKPPDTILENLAPAPDLGPRENPRIQAPRLSPEETARALLGGGPGGAISSGTSGEAASLGDMQLMSDPQGIDFKPYLLRVLTAVRQNWFSIIPAQARTGRPGLVTVQFIIDRSGGVPKLVIANPSGTLAFDRAAVAAISASYPFQPLPADYKGQEIRVQLAFTYNLRPLK